MQYFLNDKGVTEAETNCEDNYIQLQIEHLEMEYKMIEHHLEGILLKLR